MKNKSPGVPPVMLKHGQDLNYCMYGQTAHGGATPAAL